MSEDKEPKLNRAEQLQASNVLVTGGAGFIGSSLVRQLEYKNCNIIVFDNLVAGTEDNIKGTKSSFVEGDIQNRELLREIMRIYRIDYCFHLAAEPYIPKGYQYPEKMFQTNTIGTLRVLKACARANVRKIVHYSTSEVYGTAQYLPMDEKHPTQPHSIYALSKLAGDRMCYILWKEKKIPVTVIRQFNCFGPREAQPYIIPEIISQLTRGNELHLGNLQARRDFTYVDDATHAAIKIMETPGYEGGIVNIGYGKNWSVQEMAEEIAKIMGKKDWSIVVEKKKLRPFDVDELLCDNTLFNKLTGGMNFRSFREGLQLTLDWYNKHGKKWSWER
jgi:nucleoside-diphosphate-sugar epimerase